MENKVSVIMPTFKRSVDFVSRAVNSLLNQTYHNIEIICVDDSPANYEHREDIKHYFETLQATNVKYIQNQYNIGGALSRNVGIENSQGQYITFLDDDDEYLPDKVESQLNFMLENDCDLSFTKMLIYDEHDKIVDVREHFFESYDNEYLLKYHLCRHMTGTPTFMFKADKLKAIGGFDDAKCGQEFLLMLKAIEHGLAIRYIPDCHMKVYKHQSGGISFSHNKIIGEKHLYQTKKKYFRLLSSSQRAYIRFRYYAVMAVAYKRNQKYLCCIGAAICSALSSPIDIVREVIKFVRNIFKSRRNS